MTRLLGLGDLVDRSGIRRGFAPARPDKDFLPHAHEPGWRFDDLRWEWVEEQLPEQSRKAHAPLPVGMPFPKPRSKFEVEANKPPISFAERLRAGVEAPGRRMGLEPPAYGSQGEALGPVGYPEVQDEPALLTRVLKILTMARRRGDEEEHPVRKIEAATYKTLRPVQKAAGEAGEAIIGKEQGEIPLPPTFGLLPERITATGRQIGESLVPTTPLGVAAELLPGVGTVPGVTSAVRKAGPALARGLKEGAPGIGAAVRGAGLPFAEPQAAQKVKWAKKAPTGKGITPEGITPEVSGALPESAVTAAGPPTLAEPGREGIDRALRQANASVTSKRGIGLAGRPRPVVVAQVGREAAAAEVFTQQSRALGRVAREAEEAWRESPATWIGKGENPAANSLVDYLERSPKSYTGISPRLAAAKAEWKRVSEEGLNDLRARYNAVDFEPTSRLEEGGAYVHHTETREAREAKAVGGSGRAGTGRMGIEKERGYASLGARMKEDPDFAPELNLMRIADDQARQMSEVAGRAVYKDAIGGKTREEVIEELHPEMQRLRKQAASRLAGAKKSIARALQRAREAGLTEDALRAEQRAVRVGESRLASDIEDMAEELPELATMKKELGELRSQARGLDRALAKSAGQATEQESRATTVAEVRSLLDKEREQIVRVRGSITKAEEAISGPAAETGMTPLQEGRWRETQARARDLRNRSRALDSLDAKLAGTQAKAESRMTVALDKLTTAPAKDARIGQIERQLRRREDAFLARVAGDAKAQRTLGLSERRLGRAMGKLQARQAKAELKAAERQSNLPRIQAYLDEMRRRYKALGTGSYVMDPETFRYVTRDVARASTAISQQRVGVAIVDRALDVAEEARIVSLGAGDFSPITIGRGMLGAAAHPEVFARNVAGLARAARLSGEKIWESVDPEMLGLYERAHGRSVFRAAGSVPEVREPGRGLERLPGLGKLVRASNEATGKVVEYGQYKAWEADYNILRRMNPGMTEEQAAAEAASALGLVSPQVNLATSGLSQLERRFANAPFSSLAFTLAPARLAKEMTAGVVQLGRAVASRKSPAAAWQSLQGRQQLALIRGTTMIGSISAVVAASATAFGDERQTPGERAMDAVDPFSSKFWTVRTPGGGSIPVGGPFRSAITAVRTTKEKGPVVAGVKWGRGRLMTGIGTPLDLLINQNYQGKRIREGSPIDQVKDAILYGMENMNIMGGQVAEGAREGGLPGAIEQGAAGLAGMTYYERSPSQEFQETFFKKTGKDWTNLWGYEAEDLVKAHPELQGAYDDWRKGQEGAGVEITREKYDALDALGANLKSGKITPKQYREQAGDRAGGAAIAYEQARKDGKIPDYGKAEKGSPRAITDGYYSAIAPATDPKTKVTDYDEQDRLEAEYFAMLSPENREHLLRQITFSRDPTYRELKEDRLKLEPYFSVRDEEWQTWSRSRPAYAKYKSLDEFKEAKVQELMAKQPNKISRSIAVSEVDKALADLDELMSARSLTYLAKHKDLVPLLDKWGFRVPSLLLPYTVPR